MRTHYARPLFLSLLVPRSFWPPVCFAQAPLEPAQLPARTTFYLIWPRHAFRGCSQGANALLSLWDDPDSAPMRSALVGSLLRRFATNRRTISKLSPR